MQLQQVNGFVIDLDGTVYKGSEVIEGAAQTIETLRILGKRIVFLSNRGNISKKMCYNHLTRMGLELQLDEIILSSTVSAAYIKEHYQEAAVWVLGDEGLRDELREVGIQLAEHPEFADWLLITLHESLTYKDLNEAFKAVYHGARIMATNADKMFPSAEGLSIDVAGMIGAIVAATGKEVELVIGKPSQLMADAAIGTLGLPPEQCLIIGDSLESDVRLGKKAGMMTALVLTGNLTREAAELSELKPDWIWDSLAALHKILVTDEEAEGREG
jgi:arabinose operon protein AraL